MTSGQHVVWKGRRDGSPSIVSISGKTKKTVGGQFIDTGAQLRVSFIHTNTHFTWEAKGNSKSLKGLFIWKKNRQTDRVQHGGTLTPSC